MSAALSTIDREVPLRAVKVAEIRGGLTPRMHPAGRYWRRTYEHATPTRAQCHRRDHVAPAIDCTCGFHAVDEATELRRVAKVFADSVLLDVELAGTIVEHERGYRAGTQQVYGVRFSGSCWRCGALAALVQPGRLWRPMCDACAERSRARRRPVLSRAEATAMLGVDVDFGALPVEPARSRWIGGLRAFAMWLLCVVCLVALQRVPWHGVATIGCAITISASFAALVATATVRTTRCHETLFVLQCACLTAAAVLLMIATP